MLKCYNEGKKENCLFLQVLDLSTSDTPYISNNLLVTFLLAIKMNGHRRKKKECSYI